MALRWLWVFVVFFLKWQSPQAFADEKCADFNFSNNEDTIHATEGQVLEIFFTFINNCTGDNRQNKSIFIEKPSTDQKTTRLCQFLHGHSGECIDGSNDECLCPVAPDQSYTFIKKIDRSYSGTWKWSVDPPLAEDHIIDVLVEYPPQVEDVFLATSNAARAQLVRQNSSVDVICNFTRGYPESDAEPRLYDNNGDEMHNITRPDDSHIKHTLPPVQCDDLGLTVKCRFDGQEKGKTATLLVQCKPEFTKNETQPMTIARGTNAILSFPFRAPDSDLKCQIMKQESHESTNATGRDTTHADAENIHHCNEKVIGVPPNLTLELVFESAVINASEGRWQLRLWNSYGEDHVQFIVIESDGGFGLDLTSQSSVRGITMGVTCVVVLAVLITVSVICRVRKTAKDIKKRFERTQQGAVPSSFYRGSNVSLMINNEIYEDSEDQLSIAPSAVVQVDRAQHHPDDSSGLVPLALHCHAPPPPSSMVLDEGAGCMDLSSSGDETDGACADTDADGMPFVDEQENRSEEGGAGIHFGGNGKLDVPANEVRRKNQEQQKRHLKEADFQGEEHGDDSERKRHERQIEPEENSAEDGQRYVSSAEVRRQKKLQQQRIASESEDECTEWKGETIANDRLYVPAAEVRRKRRQQQTLTCDNTDVNPANWYAPVADVEGTDKEQMLRTDECDISSSF